MSSTIYELEPLGKVERVNFSTGHVLNFSHHRAHTTMKNSDLALVSSLSTPIISFTSSNLLSRDPELISGLDVSRGT